MAELIRLTAGQRLVIYQIDDETGSLDDALGRVDPGLRGQARAKIYYLLNKLAREGTLRTPDHFNTEAVLPDEGHFYAVKTNSKLRIRAYGWFSNVQKGSFIVSHYAFKRGEKLDARDTARVIANWRRIEK